MTSSDMTCAHQIRVSQVRDLRLALQVPVQSVEAQENTQAGDDLPSVRRGSEGAQPFAL